MQAIRFHWPAALLLALAVGACAQTGPVAPPPQGSCDAGEAQFAVGEPYTEQLGARARQAADAAVLRVIRPGEYVTMEFNPNRLNLRLTEGGRVHQVSCG